MKDTNLFYRHLIWTSQAYYLMNKKNSCQIFVMFQGGNGNISSCQAKKHHLVISLFSYNAPQYVLILPWVDSDHFQTVGALQGDTINNHNVWKFYMIYCISCPIYGHIDFPDFT